MKETLIQIDQTGRVVLPKPLRDSFRLRGGDMLAVAMHGDAIELRPAQKAGQLKRINGVLVFFGPGQVGTDDLVAQSREERISELTATAKKSK